MYIFCIQCIHYVYRILTFTLGSLADRQAAPPISRGSSAHGLDHPQSPRPILPPFRAFDDRFQLTEENQERERGCLASSRMSRRAALPAGAWLTFACALYKTVLTAKKGSAWRPEPLAPRTASASAAAAPTQHALHRPPRHPTLAQAPTADPCVPILSRTPLNSALCFITPPPHSTAAG